MTAYPIERVVDGDTIVFRVGDEQFTARLVGVDTPETVHPSRPVEAYGMEASRFLSNLLVGESVYVDYEPAGARVDRFGRHLVYLYRAPDGLFVNVEVIRQGYGFAYTDYPTQFLDTFREFQTRAREYEKGLWAPDIIEQWRPDAPPVEEADAAAPLPDAQAAAASCCDGE